MRCFGVSLYPGTLAVVLYLSIIILAVPGGALAESNHKILALRVSRETVPLGAMANVKLFLATPQPISSGYVTFTLAPSGFYSPNVIAAAAFGATGDVFGIGNQPVAGLLTVNFSSRAGGIGRLKDLPLIELTFVANTEVVVGVSASTSSFIDPDGNNYDLSPQAIELGGVQIGGTLSIANVTPGGGIVPDGTTITITGTGYTPNTKVTMEGVSIASTSFVSPTVMTFVLDADTEMTGKHMHVENVDGQQIDYWSWIEDLLICPLSATTSATWTQKPSISPSSILYLALQNPGPDPIDATVTNSIVPASFDSATNTFTVPGWKNLSVTLAHFGPNVITSSAPLRMMGYLVGYKHAYASTYAVEYSGPQKPLLGSVANAASLTQAAVAPGEIITIFGTGIGPLDPAGLALDENGNVNSRLMGTRVLFDDVPAPILYTSESQVNAVVPYEVAGKSVTTVQLEYNGTTAAAWGVPVAPTAPAIFTLDSSGQGPADVLNEDNSLNTAANPAERGSVVQIFATGEGQTSPRGVTGSVTRSNPNTPVLPVKATISGLNAAVLFAGSAPDAVAGLLQINAVVPLRAATGAAVPISITIGDVQSLGGLTIAVK